MKRLLLLPALFSFLSAYGQRPDSLPPLFSRFVLKLAPLGLLEIDPVVQGGIEIRAWHKFSVQGEFGYGWPELLRFDPYYTYLIGGHYTPLDEVRDKWTWRVRTEVRYYIFPPTRYSKNFPALSGFYVAGEYLYKQTNAYVQPNLGSSSRVLAERSIQGFHIKHGLQLPIGSRSGPRFIVDVYSGFGIRR